MQIEPSCYWISKTYGGSSVTEADLQRMFELQDVEVQKELTTLPEREFKMVTAYNEQLPRTIKSLLKEDAIIVAISAYDLVYVGSKEKIDSRINVEYCNENDIPFVEFLVTREVKSSDNAWLSVAGNCSLVAIVQKPVTPFFGHTLHRAAREAINNLYDIELEVNNGDGVYKENLVL
jgi:hypothetical protein